MRGSFLELHILWMTGAVEYLYYVDMTANEFCEWLKAMKISGAEAARLLSVNVNTITRYRRSGGPKMLSLACAALFHRLGVWTQ
jgi:hypothetical protein